MAKPYFGFMRNPLKQTQRLFKNFHDLACGYSPRPNFLQSIQVRTS
jgi:hypothetical protein